MQFTERYFPRTLLCVLAVALGSFGCQQQPPPAQPAQPAATPKLAALTPAPAATLAVTISTAPAVAAPAPPPPVTNAPPPGPTPLQTSGQNFDVTLLDAPKTTLNKLLGRRKVVVVNFWATWCGPCRREIPELIALQNEYKNNSAVEIVGLSIEDPQATRAAVKAFAQDFKVNYRMGFAPIPMFLAFNGQRPGAPIPQTFVFGKDGKLVNHIPGLRPAFKDYLAQAIAIALKS